MTSRKIEISHRTIIFIVFFLGLIYFLWFIKDIIFVVFVSLLIMTILNPIVTKLHKQKVPRLASVLIVYIAVLAFIIFSIGTLIPPFVEQTTNFANSLPEYLEKFKIPVVVVEEATREITAQLGKLPSQVIKITVSVFSNIVAIFMVFILALYFLLARERLDDQLNHFFQPKDVDRIDRILDTLEKKLGGWARAQIILMLMVGVSTYVGLLILGIPFALPLAILAGILEIVPNIGPIISAIPAIIIGLTISPITGLAAAALSFLIQQIEAYLFVPKVMEKSAGVSPIITLLTLIIGFRVAGIPGALLSVPVVITAQVLLQEFAFKRSS